MGNIYSKIEDKEKYLVELLNRDRNCIQISSVALRLGFNSIIERQWKILEKDALTIAST